jgi:hypothetical protein
VSREEPFAKRAAQFCLIAPLLVVGITIITRNAARAHEGTDGTYQFCLTGASVAHFSGSWSVQNSRLYLLVTECVDGNRDEIGEKIEEAFRAYCCCRRPEVPGQNVLPSSRNEYVGSHACSRHGKRCGHTDPGRVA